MNPLGLLLVKKCNRLLDTNKSLFNIGKKGCHAIKVTHRVRIKFMGMALATAEGEAQKNRSRITYAVSGIDSHIFFRLGTTFAGRHIQPVKTGRNFFAPGGIRQ